jgi:hypothetical protein
MDVTSWDGAITLSVDAKEGFISDLMARKIEFTARCINEEHWRVDKA